MFTALTRACLAAAVLAASGTQVSVFAQPPAGAPQQTAPTPAPAPVRRLAVEDAVRLAAENNLGLTIARVNPLLEDIAIAQVRARLVPVAEQLVHSQQHGQSKHRVPVGGVRHQDHQRPAEQRPGGCSGAAMGRQLLLRAGAARARRRTASWTISLPSFARAWRSATRSRCCGTSRSTVTVNS